MFIQKTKKETNMRDLSCSGHLYELENFEDKTNVALCLHSQLVGNSKSRDGQFNRVSIPLVIRILSESKAAKRNYLTNYFEDIKPEVLFFKTKFNHLDKSLETEANCIKELATNLTKEIDEFFSDKKNETITFQGLKLLPNKQIVMLYH